MIRLFRPTPPLQSAFQPRPLPMRDEDRVFADWRAKKKEARK